MNAPGWVCRAPYVRLGALAGGAHLWAKAEFMQPSGSVYDHIAGRVLDAHKAPLRTANQAVVAGGGSFCLAFSAAAARRNTPLCCVVPSGILREHRVLLLEHSGLLKIMECPLGLFATHDTAMAEAKATSSILVASPKKRELCAHVFEETLGRELLLDWKQFDDGPPEVVVAPVGSGALLLGIASALSNARPAPEIYGVVTATQSSLIDGVSSLGEAEVALPMIEVDDADAHRARIAAARTEGILIGLGSAAALHAAMEFVSTGRARRVLTIFVDGGDRYFSRDAVLARATPRPAKTGELAST